MPNLSQGQFALGGLFIFAVWLFVVLPFLYGPPPRVADSPFDWGLIFNGIVALFTAVLSLSTIGLWTATARSAKIAEKALTELDRPWLVLEAAKVTRRDPPTVPNNWYICFKWKNVSRSPAIITNNIVKFVDLTVR